MKERLFIKKAKELIQLQEFLQKEFAGIKCGLIDVAYTPLGVRITVHTTSPGLVIGHGGDKIREVSEKLRAMFGLENPQIDVQKISNPDMDPRIVSQSIAAALEKGMNPKKIGSYYLERVMRAGAVGCEIVIKGKLGGEKARSMRFTAGYIKKCGEPAKRDVITGTATALPKLGNIGVTTSIMVAHSDKKITVEKPKPAEKPPEETAVAAAQLETAEVAEKQPSGENEAKGNEA
ncbi:MAG: 30S ribosomal protein S3 [Candidatus Aenigmatarchaeota archaeon]